jgi:hypothetical protein
MMISKIERSVLSWLVNHPGAWTADEIAFSSKAGTEDEAKDALFHLIDQRRVKVAGRGLAGDEMVDLYSVKK